VWQPRWHPWSSSAPEGRRMPLGSSPATRRSRSHWKRRLAISLPPRRPIPMRRWQAASPMRILTDERWSCAACASRSAATRAGRNPNVRFPKLALRFDDDPPRDSPFARLSALKIGTHCGARPATASPETTGFQTSARRTAKRSSIACSTCWASRRSKRGRRASAARARSTSRIQLGAADAGARRRGRDRVRGGARR